MKTKLFLSKLFQMAYSSQIKKGLRPKVKSRMGSSDLLLRLQKGVRQCLVELPRWTKVLQRV